MEELDANQEDEQLPAPEVVSPFDLVMGVFAPGAFGRPVDSGNEPERQQPGRA